MSILVFDIETIPDTNSGERLYALKDLSNEDIARAMEHLQCQKTGSEFLPPHLHQIVAISVIHWASDQELKIVSLGKDETDDSQLERQLVKEFFAGINKYTPQIVSWNGNGFDLPVLHYRALLHGISAPQYWETGNKDSSFRYNNYLSRFHWRHLDLMDVLAGYQIRAHASLDQLAKMLGFPGKSGIGGEHVSAAWWAGKKQEIRDYCDVDVLNTYLIYLRFALIRGILQIEQYEQRCQQLKDLLEVSEKKHLHEFLDLWKKG